MVWHQVALNCGESVEILLIARVAGLLHLVSPGNRGNVCCENYACHIEHLRLIDSIHSWVLQIGIRTKNVLSKILVLY